METHRRRELGLRAESPAHDKWEAGSWRSQKALNTCEEALRGCQANHRRFYSPYHQLPGRQEAHQRQPPLYPSEVSKCVLVAQLCPTYIDPMDFSPLGSPVHEIFQARILEWVAIFFSRGSSQPREQTQVSHLACRLFTIWFPGGSESEDDIKFLRPFTTRWADRKHHHEDITEIS